MVVQSSNAIIPTSSGDSNDEFFEANSSFNLNVIDDKNESSIMDPKPIKDTSASTIEANHLSKTNLKKKKSLQSVRKNSSTSNQSSFSFSSNKEGLNDNQQKKTKKSSSSSTFSKIQMFRDRSNTKKSNASSDAVLTDTATNFQLDIKVKTNIQEQNIIEDEELNSYQGTDNKSNKNNPNSSIITNEDSYLASNIDTTFSDVNNNSAEIYEEKGDLSSPALSTTLNEELDINSKKASTQKTSSKYRSGKFSSTITSFLPSISAKLHHNKNKNQGDGGSSQPPTPSADNSKFPDDKLYNLSSNSPNKEKPVNKIDHNYNIEQKQMANNAANDQVSTKYKILSMMGSSKKQNLVAGKTYDNNTARGAKTSPNMIKTEFMSGSYSSQPIPFPNENNMLHNIPTNHSGYHQLGVGQDNSIMNNSLYMNRPRADTVSSQITSLSNVPSYSVWSNMGANTQDASSYQYDSASIVSSNMVQQQQMGYNIGGYGTNTTNTNWRPRSKSNVSMLNDMNSYQPYANSIYTNNVDTLSYQKSHQVSVKNILPQLENGGSMKVAPILQDDVDHSSFNWVTNYSYAPKINHLPNIIQPTDTICVSNIFSLQKTQSFPTCLNLTSYALHGVFQQFGEILSIRTLYGLNVALIEFKSAESAKMAHEVMHGQVISTSIPSEIYYAQIIPLPVSMEADSQGSGKSLLTEQLFNGNLRFVEHGQWTIPVLNGYIPAQRDSILHETKHPSNSQGNSTNEIVIEQEHCPFALPPPNLNDNKKNIDSVFKYFQTHNNSVKGEHNSVKKAMDKVLEVLSNEDLSTDPTNYGPQPNANGNSTTLANGTRKIFDSPTLRDLRKALDNKNISTLEVEQICLCMLDEIAELCSDYLGNTIIQRIYDISSPLLKNLIVENCAQYLTSISVHKNGTWAAQKLITGSSDIINNKISIVDGIKPYCLPLFTDQFGNYVIQCCLKYGPPYNSFIYDNILKNFWEIVQSRFGSRAVRAVLETSNLEDDKLSDKGDKEEEERCKIMTKKQLYSITSLVVVYSDYLATNSNGTLLLTWYLDTCTIPNRLEILSKQLSKNIVLLATHKLASLTLLKLLNHRKDDGNSKTLILNSIFGDLSVPFEKAKSSLSNSNLMRILKEAHGNGTQFILKVLSLSLIDMKYKQRAISRLHDILTSTEPEFKEAVDMMKKDKKMVDELSLGTTSVHSYDESSGLASTGKRNRALSHIFNDNVNDASNGNSNGVHARNNSIGSTISNTNSTNGGARKNRGHSTSQRNHGNSKGSIWD